MLRTVEGVATGDGKVALVELADLPEGTRVLVTVLEEDPLAGVPPPPSLIDWDDPKAVERRIAQTRHDIQEGRGYTIEEAQAELERRYASKVAVSVTSETAAGV